MLYEEGIQYNNVTYNTFRLLETLIEESTLKPMTLTIPVLSILNVKFTLILLLR